MPKGVKILLGILLPLLIIGGVAFGLAKVGVIPTQKMGAKNPALGRVLKMVGLYRPVKKAPPVAAVPAPDPLAPQRAQMAAAYKALADERASWEAQKQAQSKQQTESKRAEANALPAPKELARMATVYEEMPAASVTKIFARLPDEQVIALLRRMEEKQVGVILGSLAPERAARFTLALSRAPAPPPDRTASAQTP